MNISMLQTCKVELEWVQNKVVPERNTGHGKFKMENEEPILRQNIWLERQEKGLNYKNLSSEGSGLISGTTKYGLSSK